MLDRTSEGYLVELLVQSKAKLNQTWKLGKFDILEKNHKGKVYKNSKNYESPVF